MTMDGTPDAAAILAEMRVKVEADIQKMVDSMPEEWQASYYALVERYRAEQSGA